MFTVHCSNCHWWSSLLSRRVAQPGRISVLRQLPAIHKNLAEQIQLLVQNHHESGRLDDLKRKKTIGVDPGNAVREAMGEGIIDVLAVHALLLQGPLPGLERNVFGL